MLFANLSRGITSEGPERPDKLNRPEKRDRTDNSKEAHIRTSAYQLEDIRIPAHRAIRQEVRTNWLFP